MNIKMKLEPGARIPEKKTAGAACYDCYAYISKKVIIWPFQTKVISLGIHTEFDAGYYIEVRGRSGNSTKGIETFIGTIDADYRGIIGAITHNGSLLPRVIHRDDRIAQILVKEIVPSEFEIVNELTETERGNKGFGSTGK